MRAMILAAGRGERMRSLTDETPKALLRLNDRYLIEYSIYALANLGIREIVINICYQAEKIKAALGQGSKYDVRIIYSEEDQALETGGGILKALPLLGPDPFIVLSCDVVSDFKLQNLPKNPNKLAHLVLIDNPVFHAQGDFCLAGNNIYLGADQTYTFSNIGVYRPELFAGCTPGRFRLGTLLKEAIQRDQVSGEYFSGFWENFGTPEQLQNRVLLPDNLP